ncbi:PrkA family serine protein kinase [Thermithiobacillus plumbiphilus]|uniref:PrkA family serine protein kinase n=1 Tax=Thermithiobacillus plumbiphilus TaxID=1729899 RepID=A0ABU9D8N9_9PROT
MEALLSSIKRKFSEPEESYTIQEFLEICREDPTAYITPAERMLLAIGEPELVDTKDDPRLSRIFSNKVVKMYPKFREFYGMESAVEQIVGFFKHAAQGLEERKQILYLLGPVGGGKSSLAEKLKHLMETVPFYAIKGSPVFDNPLSLFDPEGDAESIEQEYGIPRRYLRGIMSPWLIKRLKETKGDISKLRVVKLYPSIHHQIAIAKTEPGDDNNQDISALVGKVDIRKLADYSQDDPDAYSFSGALCRGNRGIMEFVEMFKAPLKVLHPLLTATQEGNYNGTEAISGIPFEGIILAHSNESEWLQFRNNKANEAFLDRVYTIKVPYCLRVDEEVRIYEKMLTQSSLAVSPCAPGTLRMLAEFSVMTRLVKPENSSLYSKMRVYNGENIKETDPRAKSAAEYREQAGVAEGMSGISTRFAFKVLSKVFNYDATEVAANPIHLMLILEQEIVREQFSEEVQNRYLEILKELQQRYVDFIGHEIQTAYLESYSDYGQNLFDRYVLYADYWMQDNEFRDPDTGQVYDRAALNAELEKIEKPAGIANPKDFRNEIVNFSLRYRANHGGKNPRWDAYEKIKTVLEKRMFANTEEILPVISFTSKGSQEEQKKHDAFVERMLDRGYTPRQVHLVVDWFMRVRKSS